MERHWRRSVQQHNLVPLPFSVGEGGRSPDEAATIGLVRLRVISGLSSKGKEFWMYVLQQQYYLSANNIVF